MALGSVCVCVRISPAAHSCCAETWDHVRDPFSAFINIPQFLGQCNHLERCHKCRKNIVSLFYGLLHLAIKIHCPTLGFHPVNIPSQSQQLV